MTNPAATPCLACGATWNKGQGGAYKLCSTCRQTLRWCPGCKSALPRERFGTPKTDCCKPCNAEKTRARQARYPDYLLQRMYGITHAERAQIAEDQDHRCAICRREKRLVVDHCHSSGRVRGLLCDHCNQAIGRFHDDPLIVMAAADYLFMNRGDASGEYVSSREARRLRGWSSA